MSARKSSHVVATLLSDNIMLFLSGAVTVRGEGPRREPGRQERGPGQGEWYPHHSRCLGILDPGWPGLRLQEEQPVPLRTWEKIMQSLMYKSEIQTILFHVKISI